MPMLIAEVNLKSRGPAAAPSRTAAGSAMNPPGPGPRGKAESRGIQAGCFGTLRALRFQNVCGEGLPGRCRPCCCSPGRCLMLLDLFRALCAAAAAVVLPGYFWAALLRPAGGLAERLGYSSALSLATVPVVALVLARLAGSGVTL